MNEHEFLIKLEERAKENELLAKQLSKPELVFVLSKWFGNHPWRMMIPFSFLVTLILKTILGKSYLDFILRIFGGL